MTAQGETRALLILSVWAVSREITGVTGNVFVIQYVCEWMTNILMVYISIRSHFAQLLYGMAELFGD